MLHDAYRLINVVDVLLMPQRSDIHLPHGRWFPRLCYQPSAIMVKIRLAGSQQLLDDASNQGLDGNTVLHGVAQRKGGVQKRLSNGA